MADQSPITLGFMAALGSSFDEANDAEAGILVLEAVIATQRRFWPRMEHFSLASKGNLAVFYEYVGRKDEALRYYRAAYAGKMAVVGPNTSSTILSASNLTVSLLDNALFAEAKPFARQQLAVAKRALADNDVERIRASFALADALTRAPSVTRAELFEAEALLAEAAKPARQFLGPLHPLTAALVEKLKGLRQVTAKVNSR